MNSITDLAEGCNVIPTANSNKNTASDASVPEVNASISSGEEDDEAQLREADKCNAKIHCLSRVMAKQYGIIPAAVLAGFAGKLKYHKLNQWDGRWWYYDSIETLRTHRWPYLSDGCICQTIDYLQGNHLLIKGCNNKVSYDRTSWYAMDDSVKAAALSDLIWYDVAVTRKLNSIPAGLIYHNLRFHLRKMVGDDAECQLPYHQLNKAMLARLLPISESTVKRCVADLLEAEFIIRHDKKRSLFTIADESQYRGIGSNVNANRSKVNGSSVNANRSKVNAIGSSMNANGSKVNDYTQYETSGKPMRNHSEGGECVSDVLSSSDKGTTNNDKLDGASFVDHKHISDTVGSAPLRGREEAEAAGVSLYPAALPTTFDQLVHQTKISITALQTTDPDTKAFIIDSFTDLCTYFVEHHLSAKDIHELWDNNNRDILLKRLSQPFADYIASEVPGWHEFPISVEQLWQLLYYPQLETIVRSFAKEEVWSGKQTHTMDGHWSSIKDTHWALLTKLLKEPSFSSEIKVELLVQLIVLLNKNGWSLRDNSHKLNAVQPVSSAKQKLKELFALNPELTVWQVYNLLDQCVDVSCMEDEPAKGGNDPYWHVRRVKNLQTFVTWLEPIIKELDMFEACPIHHFPTVGKRNP